MISNVTLRALTKADAPTVQAWLHDFLEQHRREWSKAYGVDPRSELGTVVTRDWEDLVKGSQDNSRFIRVAAEGAALGIVSARLRQDAFLDLNLGVLSWVYVAPEVRGKGVADRLMTAARDWMRQEGAQGREVFVSCTNRAAIDLYKRHGFYLTDHRMLGAP